MDEYDYLEAQLEGGAKAAAQEALPPPPPVETKSRSSDRRRSRSRSKDRSRKSSRRSRSPRERSRSRDRRDRDRRDNGRDDRKSRDKSRERSNARERTPPELRLQREKEQELKDLERAVRTVMVMNINLKADERDIFNFFASVGRINDIKLIRDKHTKKSKGIAYVEFSTVEAAISALTLNQQILLSMPVLIKPSEAEKNLAWEAQQQAKQNQMATVTLLNKMGGTAPGVKLNPIKLQILDLHPDIGEDDLRELFRPFGEINYVRVVLDSSNRSTGEAYVQYADEPMANAAIKHFNGFELAGKKLKVQVAPVINPLAAQFDPSVISSAVLAAGGAGAPGAPGLPGALPMPGAPPAAFPPPPEVAAPVQNVHEMDDLDESNEKAFRLNAQSRAALMSRLATSAGLAPPPSFLASSGAPAGAPAAAPAAPALNVPQAVLLDQGLLGPASPIPTPCILLKNMFSDADKVDANWQADVADDVRSEAEKFGQVVHVHVNPDSKGHVYIKFAAVQGAEAASRALHGRYYSGNQIVVSYQFLQPYNSFFGLK